MKAIRPLQTLEVPVERGKRAIHLLEGVWYVMHDVEAASGLRAGVLEISDSLPDAPQRFTPEALDGGGDGKRLLVPFIGGLGDGIAVLPLLQQLKTGLGEGTLHVATTLGPGELFSYSPVVQEVMNYPLTLEQWSSFDLYASFEGVAEHGLEPGASLTQTFARALDMYGVPAHFPLQIPGFEPKNRDGTNDPPLVGLAVPDGQSLRHPALTFYQEVVEGCRARGYAVVLFGLADPAWAIPEEPPMLTDMRGKTPSIMELGVWLNEMDVLIAHDSFPMHLAGAISLPTISTFGPTGRGIADDYEMITALQSQLECSPCHVASSVCPKGYDRCRAWDDGAVSSSRVLMQLDQMMLRLNGVVPPEVQGV